MLRSLIIALVTFAAAPALAAATPWQEIAPEVRARLVSSDVLDNGSSLAGLEIDMPEGTKTYWRIPGETGIPTEFDFSGSAGVANPTVQWPYPEIDQSDGYLDYVFHGPVVLPIRFEATAGGATLTASVTLGICSDMCVPAMAKFTLPIDFGKPDPAQSLRLDQALATVPIAWDQPGSPVGAVSAGPEGLVLVGLDPAIDPASIIADVGDPGLLFGVPQKSPDGNLWTLKLLGGATEGLRGRPVQLTFVTAMGPYAVTRDIAPSE